MQDNRTFIERAAESLGIIKKLNRFEGKSLLPLTEEDLPRLTEPGDLTNYPPPDQWDNWVEYEATAWPKKVKKNYSIVPTTCFNCEAACGLLAYIEKDTQTIRKFVFREYAGQDHPEPEEFGQTAPLR